MEFNDNKSCAVCFGSRHCGQERKPISEKSINPSEEESLLSPEWKELDIMNLPPVFCWSLADDTVSKASAEWLNISWAGNGCLMMLVGTSYIRVLSYLVPLSCLPPPLQ